MLRTIETSARSLNIRTNERFSTKTFEHDVRNCSVFLVPSPFITYTYNQIFDESTTPGETCGKETQNPSCAPGLTHGSQWGSYFLIFSFLSSMLLIIVCLFALIRLIIVFSVLRFTTSDYLFGIFKLFLHMMPSDRCSIFKIQLCVILV